MSKSVAQQIKASIEESGRGTICCVPDYAHIGSNEAVTRAFSRLCLQDFIVRLYNGVYLYPKRNRFGIEYPTLQQIAEAIAQRDKVNILPTGASAANALGLSEQVPVNAVYVTSGTPRTVHVGNRSIEFKRQTPKFLQYKSRTMPLLVAAIKEIGQADLSPDQKNRIENILHTAHDRAFFKEDLLLAPAWIRKYLNPLLK